MDTYIIYLRKSRSDDPSMSVEEVLSRHEYQLQEYALQSFGKRIPEESIYREVVSGETINDRPVMQQIMRLLETGAIKGVLVVDPQRLSRGDLEDCGRIVNVFRYTGTLVVTPPKTYNLTDEYDRKFFEMELTRGNDYLEYTKKILLRGRLASVRQGNFIGSVAPYGYRKVTIGSGKNVVHTLEIVPEEAEAIRQMYRLFLDEEMGFKRIADRLEAAGYAPRKSAHWSPAAIKDMLENPVYIGKIRWNWRKTEKVMENGKIVKTRPKTKDAEQWVYADGKHKPIIDEATYQAALARRGSRPRVSSGKELSNPFAGLVFCECGRAMSYKRYTDSRRKTGHVTQSMLCNNQSRCHTKSVRYDAFVDRVVSTLSDAVDNFRALAKQQDTALAQHIHQEQIARLRLDVKRLEEKDRRQKDAYENGVYSLEEYAARNAKLQEQLSSATAALLDAQASSPEVIDYEERIVRFQNCIASLLDPDLPAGSKNTVLKECIRRITYHNHMESRAGIGRFVENEFSLDVSLKL